jgi:hypothetical protein
VLNSTISPNDKDAVFIEEVNYQSEGTQRKESFREREVEIVKA